MNDINIDEIYLQGLDINAIKELKILNKNCEKNKILNAKTGYCVKIDGVIGKKILKELQSQITNTPKSTQHMKIMSSNIVPYDHNSCSLPAGYPPVRKPIFLAHGDQLHEEKNIKNIESTRKNNDIKKQNVKKLTDQKIESKLCSKKSKNARNVGYVCNPESGIWVEIGGPTHKKLIKIYGEVYLQEYSRQILQ